MEHKHQHDDAVYNLYYDGPRTPICNMDAERLERSRRRGRSSSRVTATASHSATCLPPSMRSVAPSVNGQGVQLMPAPAPALASHWPRKIR